MTVATPARPASRAGPGGYAAWCDGLAGLISGFVVGGIGGRIAMRIAPSGSVEFAHFA